MGMFDRVWVSCPCCGDQVEFQTKAGECSLIDYRIHNVPPIIAGDLDGDMEECHGCGKVLTLRTQCIMTVDIQ